MVNSNKKNVIGNVVLLILFILIVFIAYKLSYHCNTVVIPPLCEHNMSLFVSGIIELSIPILSLFFIIQDIIHKVLFKKGKKIIDTLLILAFIYFAVSATYYIKFRIDEWRFNSHETVGYKQINICDKEYITFLEGEYM